jgi:hypothetical protein
VHEILAYKPDLHFWNDDIKHKTDRAMADSRGFFPDFCLLFQAEKVSFPCKYHYSNASFIVHITIILTHCI